MAALPSDIEVLDRRSDEGDWDFQALVPVPGEKIALDLRIHDESDYRPVDPAAIVAQLRRQLAFDNYRPLVDQVRERAKTPVTLGFFQ
jgi:hypothetical protein